MAPILEYAVVVQAASRVILQQLPASQMYMRFGNESISHANANIMSSVVPFNWAIGWFQSVWESSSSS